MRCFLLVVLGMILVTSAPKLSTVPSGKVAQFPLSKQFPIPRHQPTTRARINFVARDEP